MTRPTTSWTSTPVVVGLWLPLLVVVIGVVAPVLGYEPHPEREFSLIENLTVLFLLPAIAIGWTTGRDLAPDTPQRSLRLFFALGLVFGGIYFAGEELSWGQHFVGWSTPESFQTWNDQGETNIHNSRNYWIDNLAENWPKAALHRAAPLFGGGLPALVYLLGLYPSPKEPLYWFSHRWRCALPGLAIPLVSLIRRAGELRHGDPDYYVHLYKLRPAETYECLIALFILAFALSVRDKHRALAASSPE